MRRVDDGFAIFDVVEGKLELSDTISTASPLQFSVEDVRLGKLNGKKTDLPDLSGKSLALDLETCPQAEWTFLETAGLDPYLGQIRLVQISDGQSIWVIDCFHTDCKGWLLHSLRHASEVIAHNARFECKFITLLSQELLSINWRCTHQAYSLLNYFSKHDLASVVENRIKPLLENWLVEHGKDLTYSLMSKDQQRSDWSAPHLKKVQILYAARDVAYLHLLHETLLAELESEGMANFYTKIQCSLIPILADIENRGYPVNREYQSRLIGPLRIEVEQLGKAAHTHLIQAYQQYGDYQKVQALLKSGMVSTKILLPSPQNILYEDLNPSSPSQLLQIFNALGAQVEDAKKETIAGASQQLQLPLDGEIVDLAHEVLTWKARAKDLEFVSKFGEPYPVNPNIVEDKPYLHPKTHRAHTEFRELVTGRIGATGGSDSDDDSVDTFSKSRTNKGKPWMTNLQQIPRDLSIRQIFGFSRYQAADAMEDEAICVSSLTDHWEHHGPPWKGGQIEGIDEEFVIVGADYSALEAYIAAHYSQDTALIEAVSDPLVDFHTRNASLCYGVPLDQVNKIFHRQPVKNVWYCKCYGGGAAKIATTANTTFIEQGIDFRVTTEEMAELSSKFDDLYPGLTTFMNYQINYVMSTPEGKTPNTKLGRRRFLLREKRAIEQRHRERGTLASMEEYTVETKAMNDPMQSLNSEILKLAMITLWNKVVIPGRKYGYHIELATPVHDELAIFCPRSIAEKVAVAMQKAMVQAFHTVLCDEEGTPTFPDYQVNVSIGPSWAHVH